MLNYIVISILIIMIIFLIYKLKKANYILKNTNKVNESMYKIGKSIESTDNLDDLYGLILRELVYIIDGASKGSILIYDEESKSMKYKSTIGYDFNKLKNIELDIEELYLYKKTKLKHACIIKNPEKYDSSNLPIDKYKLLKDINALNIKSVLSLPLHIDNRLFGVLNIDSQVSNYAFSSRDLKIATYIKQILEQSIKTVLLINTLKEYANHDYLTGAINRRYFENQFRSINSKSKCVLALIDLNDFKLINDKYGHLEGDIILKKFSNIVKNHIRSEDLFVRMGGDEFIILFKNIDIKMAENRIKEIKEKLNGTIKFGVGLEEIDLRSNTPLDELIDIVDKKMYKDKFSKKS